MLFSSPSHALWCFSVKGHRQASKQGSAPASTQRVAAGALQHAQLDCLMPLHNSNLLPEGLLALREFKFSIPYATVIQAALSWHSVL